MSQQLLEQIPGLLGYLEMNFDGNIIKSAGELENEQHTAKHLYDLYTKCTQVPFNFKDDLRRVSVNYNDFSFIMMTSGDILLVVKKPGRTQEPALF